MKRKVKEKVQGEEQVRGGESGLQEISGKRKMFQNNNKKEVTNWTSKISCPIKNEKGKSLQK